MLKLLVLAIVVVAVTSSHTPCTTNADCNTYCQHLHEVPKCVHHGHHYACHCEHHLECSHDDQCQAFPCELDHNATCIHHNEHGHHHCTCPHMPEPIIV